MVRGRGYSPRGSYTPRGSSYRGSTRGNPWHSGGSGGGRGFGRSPRENSYSYNPGYENKGGRYSERFDREEYPSKPYRGDSYSRERHSPERKRPRHEGPPRHEYGGRYESYQPERRSYSTERHPPSPYTSSRREEFRKPAPPSAPRGGGRGRISSTRGMRGIRRERGGRVPSFVHKLGTRSYAIRKRGSTRGDFSSRFRLVRVKSGPGVRRRRPMLSSGDEKESSDEEVAQPKVKKEKDEGDAAADTQDDAAKEGADDSKEAKNDEEKKTAEKKSGKVYFKLICPQCNVSLPTFRRYEMHLQGRTHQLAMRRVAAKQRTIVSMMRLSQRNSQNELEKSGEGITEHTVFCPLCKLNYKQERAVHQATAAHKNMKKLLMPTCKVCKKAFKSAMVYEHHLCSIDHLKCKQQAETSGKEPVADDNLEEFTTIDSVGEVGDEAAGSSEEKEKEEKKKKRVSVGIEQIKRIEAYYCDLCRMFLPIGTENEYPDILAGHCRKRFHMQRYIRFKENEELKQRAEKLQRKEIAEKEKKDTDEKKEGEEEEEAIKTEEETKPKGEEEEKDLEANKSADEDKLWDAVDKDLGELLEATDGRDDDDDEERLNGERYDRLTSDKAGAVKEEK